MKVIRNIKEKERSSKRSGHCCTVVVNNAMKLSDFKLSMYSLDILIM